MLRCCPPEATTNVTYVKNVTQVFLVPGDPGVPGGAIVPALLKDRDPRTPTSPPPPVLRSPPGHTLFTWNIRTCDGGWQSLFGRRVQVGCVLVVGREGWLPIHYGTVLAGGGGHPSVSPFSFCFFSLPAGLMIFCFI